MLPTGIPSTVEELLSVVVKTFQLYGEFGLLYEDKDFGRQFYSVTSTADPHDKATVKVIRKENVITLDLQTVDTFSSPSSLTTQPGCSDMDTCPADNNSSSLVSDCASSSSKDTIILPDSRRSAPWPVPFQVPQFSRDIELILAQANESYCATGTHFRDTSVKSAIMNDLAKVIFSHTAYPSNQQILSVSEALVEKFPHLKEPGSFLELYGWQQRIKTKMHNYRAKLKSRKYAYPEIEVNTLRRKHPADAGQQKMWKNQRKRR